MNIGEIWSAGNVYYFIDKICLTNRSATNQELGVYFTRLGDITYGENWKPPITRTGFCYMSTFRTFNLKKVE